MEKYLPDAEYAAVVHELLTSAADEHDHENSIKITLGEKLGIWPKSVKRPVAVIGISI